MTQRWRRDPLKEATLDPVIIGTIDVDLDLVAAQNARGTGAG